MSLPPDAHHDAAKPPRATTQTPSAATSAGTSGVAEAVRHFLHARGAPPHVVAGGLEGLIQSWERTAGEVADGYRLGALDYLNDVDGRQILDEALTAAGPAERERLAPRLGAADGRIRPLLAPTARCAWGENAARKHGWTAQKNWWYFSHPRAAGPAWVEEMYGRATD